MRQFLRKYCARIVGGTTKGLFPTYIIEIVPLGPAYDDLKELIRRIRGERGVREASEWYYREDASVGMGTEPGNSSQLLRPNDPA